MTNPKINIALVGPPGSGKSAVGKALAAHLGRPFFDTDDALEEQLGCPIGEFFEKNGEAAFRVAESAMLEKACALRGLVIAAGGGILISPKNRRLIENNCVAFNLRASIEQLLARLGDSTHRPLLRGERRDRLAALIDSRKELYDRVDHQVDTEGRTVQQIVGDIAGLLLPKNVSS